MSTSFGFSSLNWRLLRKFLLKNGSVTSLKSRVWTRHSSNSTGSSVTNLVVESPCSLLQRTQREERCGVTCNNYDDNQQQHQQHQRWSTNSASTLRDHEPLFRCDTSCKSPASPEERLLSFTRACKNTYKLSPPSTFCSKEDFNTCPRLASTPMAPCYPLGRQRSHSAPPCRECGRGKSYFPSRCEGFCRTTGSSPPRQYACGCWGSLEADVIPLPLKDLRFQQQQQQPCYSPRSRNNKSLNASGSSPATQLRF